MGPSQSRAETSFLWQLTYSDAYEGHTTIRVHTHLTSMLGTAPAVGMPDILQLTTNYRTHQGILNTAALVVDLLKVCGSRAQACESCMPH